MNSKAGFLIARAIHCSRALLIVVELGVPSKKGLGDDPHYGPLVMLGVFPKLLGNISKRKREKECTRSPTARISLFRYFLFSPDAIAPSRQFFRSTWHWESSSQQHQAETHWTHLALERYPVQGKRRAPKGTLSSKCLRFGERMIEECRKRGRHTVACGTTGKQALVSGMWGKYAVVLEKWVEEPLGGEGPIARYPLVIGSKRKTYISKIFVGSWTK